MQDKIRIAGIVEESIVDGPGIRYVLFTQGCPHNCKGCHNPQTHDFTQGRVEDIQNIASTIDSDPLLKGITFSGGEPFMQANQISNLIDEVKNKKLDIITYTGFKYEYLLDHACEENGYMKLLEKTDILIDGKFELDKKNENLAFRGSSNQRAIDVKESLKSGEIIEYKF